ncbi:MAG: hypothetical protein M1840_001354 [Geoglossum simile]|nr:MAG: hypothetical protein M1840_001354 [Geoglossum simile]
MSDSGLSSRPSPSPTPSSPTPSDAALTAALRDAVRRTFNAGDLGDLTVKRVRAAAERELQLSEDFFKGHPEWRARSKEIVEAEADAQFAANEVGNGKPSNSPATKPSAPRKGATDRANAALPKKPAKADAVKRGTKRSSPTVDPKPKKRQKKVVVPSPDLEESASDGGSESPKEKGLADRGTTIKLERRIVERDEDDGPKGVNHGRSQAKMASKGGDKENAKKLQGKKSHESNTGREGGGLAITLGAEGDIPKPDDTGSASESEMSVVIDEEPKTKRKKRPSDTSASKAKVSKQKAPLAVPKGDGTPEAEVKRLQSWLLKCGIRKVWSKELAPYSTPKSKISHLKQMLKDVGMEGRFSAEKARQIKEEREFRADLEAVQDGARRWGDCADEDEETCFKPRRRLARGLRELDFLGSGGEETE